MSATTRVAGASPDARRLAGTAALAAATTALALGITALLARPLLLAAVAGALVLGGVAIALARRHGAHALWLGAILGSIVAGELSAIPLGGQSGRLLWADAVVAAGALIALARSGFAFHVPRAPFVTLLLAWIAWSTGTMVFARDPLTAIAEIKEWAVAWVVALVAFRFVTDGGRARLLLQALAVLAAITAVGMVVSAAQSPYGWVLAVLLKKVDLPWGRSNYLAGLLILGLPVTIGLLGAARGAGPRLAALALVLVQALGLALSASKGAILAFAAGMLIAFAPASRAARLSLAVALGVFGAGAALFLAGPLRQVLVYRLQSSAVEYSVGERMDLYELAWRSFLASPWWGLGLNNFSVASNRLTGVDTVPHHLELGLLAEVGWPGLLLALLWIGALGWECWRARDARRPPAERMLGLGVWAAFVAFFLHNQIESTIYGQQYKMVLVVCAAAAWRLASGELPHPHSYRAMRTTEGDPIVRS